MKHQIENKQVWIYCQHQNDGHDHSLLATCDQQICGKCEELSWILYITLDDEVRGLCRICIERGFVEHKLDIPITICEKRHCPFCNKSAKFCYKICQSCLDSLEKSTAELYEICTFPSKKQVCRCKYCKIFKRCKK